MSASVVVCAGKRTTLENVFLDHIHTVDVSEKENKRENSGKSAHCVQLRNPWTVFNNIGKNVCIPFWFFFSKDI